MLAADLLVQIRANGIACHKCPVWLFLEQGDEEYYEQNCTPQLCALNRYQDLENREKWQFFEELMAWQENGLESVVDDCLRSMSVVEIRAFLAFKQRLKSATESEIRKQALLEGM